MSKVGHHRSRITKNGPSHPKGKIRDEKRKQFVKEQEEETPEIGGKEKKANE